MTGSSENIRLIPGEYRLYSDVKIVNPLLSSTQNIGLSEENGFHVFPNPSSNFCYIEMTNPNSSKVSVEFFTTEGIMVKEIKGIEMLSGRNMIEVDIQDLASGTYLVVCKLDAHFWSSKLLIQR